MNVIFDPLYLLLIAPAMLLSAWAAYATRSRFAHWSRVPNMRHVSGQQVARFILDRNGLRDVPVVPARGTLSDHYDPQQRIVRLSEDVFHGASVAALAVAAHEVGHAIQHQRNYAPLALRSMAVPIASIGSNFGWFLIVIGMVLAMTQLVWLGVLLFAGTVAFQLITLPVEFDASRRAEEQLEQLALAAPGERRGIHQVLSAAAMTYVGAALSGILTLFYFLIRLGAFDSDE